jgi:hypothetical protein
MPQIQMSRYPGTKPSGPESSGPMVSVYLNTPGGSPAAAGQISACWQLSRAQLVAAGAPMAALNLVDQILPNAYLAGRALAVFAGIPGPGTGQYLSDPPRRVYHLPEPLEPPYAAGYVEFGPLAHLTPLILSTQRLSPQPLAICDRLGAYLEQGLAVAGPERTLDALGQGSVDILLLVPESLRNCQAWFGQHPTQVAYRPAQLRLAGVTDVQPARLEDVAIRAALALEATVRIVPEGTVGMPSSGIAARLRT